MWVGGRGVECLAGDQAGGGAGAAIGWRTGPGRLLARDAVDRLPDHVGDGLRLGDHDHVRSLDLGDCRSGALGHFVNHPVVPSLIFSFIIIIIIVIPFCDREATK